MPKEGTGLYTGILLKKKSENVTRNTKIFWMSILIAQSVLVDKDEDNDLAIGCPHGTVLLCALYSISMSCVHVMCF
jgi:hypothetical protein